MRHDFPSTSINLYQTARRYEVEKFIFLVTTRIFTLVFLELYFFLYSGPISIHTRFTLSLFFVLKMEAASSFETLVHI